MRNRRLLWVPVALIVAAAFAVAGVSLADSKPARHPSNCPTGWVGLNQTQKLPANC